MVLDYLYQSDSWRMFLQPQPIIIAPSAVLDLDAWNSIAQAVETISYEAQCPEWVAEHNLFLHGNVVDAVLALVE